MDTIQKFSLTSPRFYGALLIHMRPYLLFVSGAAGLAGMAISETTHIGTALFLMAFIPFFLGYGFGQALTDCFQVDTDSISAPYRPLVKGSVSPRDIGAVSLSGLILIGTAIIFLNPYNLLWCVLSIAGLATYTYFKKNYWFAGPFYNGWIVMLLPVMGFMAMSEGGYAILANAKLWSLCGLSLFSYANFVLMGYLKDITADRETGYNTFPVKFGWDATVWAGDLFVLFAVVFSYTLVGFDDMTATIIWMSGTVIALSGQLSGHFMKKKVEAHASYPIISTVRAFILWHLAAVVHFRPQWLLFSILLYLLFELVLFTRPEKEQI